MTRIGAIALGHAAGADREGNIQEDGQVPLVKEFVTVKEHALHDHDRLWWHHDRVVVQRAVRAEVECAGDDRSAPAWPQALENVGREGT